MDGSIRPTPRHRTRLTATVVGARSAMHAASKITRSMLWPGPVVRARPVRRTGGELAREPAS